MTDTTTDDTALASLRIVRTLRRCYLQPSRPSGVTQDEEKAATDAGYLRFVEGTYTGRYTITGAGWEFLIENDNKAMQNQRED